MGTWVWIQVVETYCPPPACLPHTSPVLHPSLAHPFVTLSFLPSFHPAFLSSFLPSSCPAEESQVAVLDATNSTEERRSFLRSRFHGKWQYLFIESICNDMEVRWAGAVMPLMPRFRLL